MTASIAAYLERALADLEPSPEKLAALVAHWRLVRTWNERTNLTAITSDSDAAWLHYRDSLELVPHLRDGSIIDIGSGGGFPGIPLAVWCEVPVCLLEPRRKRATFLRQVVVQLGLVRVEVVEGRSTDPPRRLYDNVVTRATFSERADLLACRKWLAPEGRLIAMRAGAGEPAAPLTREYLIGDHHRVLEIWEN